MALGLPLWGWLLGGAAAVLVVVVLVGIWFYPRDNSF